MLENYFKAMQEQFRIAEKSKTIAEDNDVSISICNEWFSNYFDI